MDHKIKYFSLLIFCFVFIQCGTTKIITDSNLNANIYVNGEFKGKKIAEISRMGPPKKIDVVAKYEGETIGNIMVKRKFDMATCLVGYFTYGIGLFTAWRFPSCIVIPTHYELDKRNSPWDYPRNNVWMNPIKK